MSAKLVRHMSTTPVTRVELEVRSNIRQRAEYLAGRTPGQLWERVAEGRAKWPYQLRVGVHDSIVEYVQSGRTGIHGPHAILWPSDTSGIIRAGQRVR